MEISGNSESDDVASPPPPPPQPPKRKRAQPLKHPDKLPSNKRKPRKVENDVGDVPSVDEQPLTSGGMLLSVDEVTSEEAPFLPPLARSLATIEGSRAQPLYPFDAELNTEPVIESELEQRATEWATISPHALVYARWKDGSYYSGMLLEKGEMDGTWWIQFDDQIKALASQSHILPITILGVGIHGIYCPDDHYEAKPSVVIGQKLVVDQDAGLTIVKYAIRYEGEPSPIWCSRRQLTIAEVDAKKLRPESLAFSESNDVAVSPPPPPPQPPKRKRGRPPKAPERDSSNKKKSVERDGQASQADAPAPLPPLVRWVANNTGAGHAEPLSRLAKKMKNEPVILSELEGRATHWGSSSSISPNEWVFARWPDGSYYSGVVERKGAIHGTWWIEYDDQLKTVASEAHIIPVKILGVGVEGIYCPDDSIEEKAAVVIGQKLEMLPESGAALVKYAIQCEGDPTPIWCSRRQLSFKDADVNKLRATCHTRNIVSGPRPQISRKQTGAAEGHGLERKPAIIGVAFSTSPEMTPKGRGGGTLEGFPTRIREHVGSSHSQGAIQGSQQQQVDPQSNKKSNKTLFQGKRFFVTASQSDRDPHSNPFITFPYCSYEWSERIRKCGGKILYLADGDEGEEENPEARTTFLISDGYCRRQEYLYCLAAGIPCLSYQWAKQCLKEGRLVEWETFTLGAGWDLEAQEDIEIQKVMEKRMEKPLKGCKIFVAPEAGRLFSYFWTPVLKAAEVVLLEAPPQKGEEGKGTSIPEGTELVVLDGWFPDGQPELLAAAEALKVPLVPEEWLIQTIIRGEWADTSPQVTGEYRFELVENPKFLLDPEPGKEEAKAIYAMACRNLT